MTVGKAKVMETADLRELRFIAAGGDLARRHYSDGQIARAQTVLAERERAFESFADMRREIGRVAAAAVKLGAAEDWALHSVIGHVEHATAGWNVNGHVRARHEATSAVKSRVTIGRGASRDAYWFPKGEGRLSDKRTPNGGRLGQTTLALNAPFRRLR